MIPFLFGICAGLIASHAAAASRILTPFPAFGLLPVLAGLLPALAGALPARLRALLEGAPRRLAAAAVAALLPVAMFLLQLATDGWAFLPADPGALPFVALALLYGCIGGVPLLLASALFPEGLLAQPERRAAAFGGAAVAFGALQHLSFSADYRLAWALSAAVLLILLSAAATRRLRLPAATAEQPRKTAGRPAKTKPGASAHGASHAAASHGAPARGTAAPEAAPLPWRALFLASLLVPVWLLVAQQRLLELTLSQQTLLVQVLPGILLAIGLGAAAGRAAAARIRVPLHAAVLPLLAAAVAVASWRLDGGLFNAIYLAFMGGNSTAVQLWEAVALALLLPAFLFGALLQQGFAARRAGAQAPEPRRTGGMPSPGAALAAGLAAAVAWYAIAPGLLTLPAVAIAVCAGMLIASGMDAWQRRALRGAQAALPAVALLALGGSCLVRQPFVHSLFEPTRFKVLQERVHAGGRLTLLQSRDYDDPFLAVAWNHGSSLTQNSRTVQDALAKMGHLPMFLAADRPSVLLLGMGSAVPLTAVAMHHPSRLVCVEETADFIAMADSFASRRHQRSVTRSAAWHAERIPAYIARGGERFDVIISAEPFARPSRDCEALTVPFYRGVAGRLKPGGLFAQWLPVGSLGSEGLRSVVAALNEAFPSTELWIANADPDNMMACVLCRRRDALPPPDARARFESMMRNDSAAFALRTSHMKHWCDVVGMAAADRPALAAFAAGAAPLGRFSPSPLAAADQPPAQRWNNAAALLQLRRLPLRLAATLDDSTRLRAATIIEERATVLQAGMASAQGDDSTAMRLLFDIARPHPFHYEAVSRLAELLMRRSALFIGQENYAAAVPLLNQVIALVPLNTYVLRQLMIASMALNDRVTAGICIDALKRLDPSHAGFRDNQATMRARFQNQVEDALLLYENAITLDPSNEEFYCNMAALQYSGGRVWEAVRILENAGRRAYYPAKAHYLRGRFYLERGRREEGLDALKDYLAVAKPDDPAMAEVQEMLRGGGVPR